MTYYNENDPSAVAWLQELIKGGHIPPGDVDDRSIVDVQPEDLNGYTQHHFFAGIGGWAYALRLAGWPEDRPVATASCPCQPFSVAGKGLGTKDQRHLWPEFHRINSVCRFPNVFGEQVASKDGRVWLSGVRADLETLGYEVGGSDLCAAGVGSPNLRQRIYWVAYATGERRTGFDALLRSENQGRVGAQTLSEVAGSGATSGVANTESSGRAGQYLRGDGESAERIAEDGPLGRLADADGRQSRDRDVQRCGQHGQQPSNGGVGGLGDPHHQRSQGRGLQFSAESGRRTPWASGFDVLHCTDGKSRRVESGSFPLAHGVSGRVGLLRGYGNAINPWLAAEFIIASEEASLV